MSDDGVTHRYDALAWDRLAVRVLLPVLALLVAAFLIWLAVLEGSVLAVLGLLAWLVAMGVAGWLLDRRIPTGATVTATTLTVHSRAGDVVLQLVDVQTVEEQIKGEGRTRTEIWVSDRTQSVYVGQLRDEADFVADVLDRAPEASYRESWNTPG